MDKDNQYYDVNTNTIHISKQDGELVETYNCEGIIWIMKNNRNKLFVALHIGRQ